jgi:hypothetical protein
MQNHPKPDLKQILQNSKFAKTKFKINISTRLLSSCDSKHEDTHMV